MSNEADKYRGMTDEELAATESVRGEPGSHSRDKRRAMGQVGLYLAELNRRAEGLTGEALAAEANRTIEEIVEYHLRVVPRRAREEARAKLREMLENDPHLAPLVKGFRAATK
jgi:hypothetical protein